MPEIALSVCQMLLYMARKPDPFTLAIVVMQQLWTKKALFGSPPFYFGSRVFLKTRIDQAEQWILVPRTQHRQRWYPQLLDMLISNHFPKQKDHY